MTCPGSVKGLDPHCHPVPYFTCCPWEVTEYWNWNWRGKTTAMSNSLLADQVTKAVLWQGRSWTEGLDTC